MVPDFSLPRYAGEDRDGLTVVIASGGESLQQVGWGLQGQIGKRWLGEGCVGEETGTPRVQATQCEPRSRAKASLVYGKWSHSEESCGWGRGES